MTENPQPGAVQGRDAEHQQALYRLRRIHLTMLVVILVAAIALVASRGVSARGIALLAVISTILAFRWWQLRKSRPLP